ncbi:MAG: glycosyl hydrolase [Bacteroidota bacterium]
MKPTTFLYFGLFLLLNCPAWSQSKPATNPPSQPSSVFDALSFRNIGPFRGGRSNAVCGVPGQPLRYFFGSTGGGVWKTEDAGNSWVNISDAFFKTGSVGAIAVAPSDPNVIYVGMGEHAVRGVMTSAGDGVYRSTDAGQTWQHIGLDQAQHIAAIRIHPHDPQTLWVAVQGALYGPSEERGIYKSTDGGANWQKVLFVNEQTGAADLSLDANNPRILYAATWEHRRYPWKIVSGGAGSGIYKSVDGGLNWERLSKGLPEKMGKVAVDVSPANSQIVYANIEAEKGGVFRSNDGGKSWQQVNSQRLTVARAWYYIEIFADPQNAETVYVLNAPMLKSTNGGKTFQRIPVAHTDQHDLWINPDQPQNMILANDGGACISFNGGTSWSTQNNQPTAQFYRVITDRQFPYHIYGGQQDNSTVAIASRTAGGHIDQRDWYPVAGGESAFLAFDPDAPQQVFGTSIQGFIDVYDHRTKNVKDIMALPMLNLGRSPEDMAYRFNWNGPLVAQAADLSKIQHNETANAVTPRPPHLYHGGNVVLKSEDAGHSWRPISADLTRNETAKHGQGGTPFTNEAAGGEVYNTISYLAASSTKAGELWVGTDDGLVHLTQDDGQSWQNITPPNLPVALINAIELSPHQAGKAYLAITRYKFMDLQPLIYITDNYGKSWRNAVRGIKDQHFVRVVREDPQQAGLLYAGTENGLYLSFDDGRNWTPFHSNLPPCPITDLCITDNDLVLASAGRGFWILDDLGVLQQSLGTIDSTQTILFQPKSTAKFTTGSSGKASLYAGQNPASGVLIDYYLPHDWADSMQLTLDILDQNGQVIRSMSNQKPKKMKRWEGGPPPPVVLPAQAGLNRINWDLRRQMLPAIPKVFVLGDYRGHLVAPGTYTLRLATPTDTLHKNCQVLTDPRIQASPDAYQTQQALLLKIEKTVKKLHQSVNQLRKVQEQLDLRMELLADQPAYEALVDKGKAAQKAIVDWEQQLIQSQQETFQDVINFPNRLNAELLMLKGQIDSPAPQPTTGAQKRLDQLLAQWKTYEQGHQSLLQKEVDAFNQAYRAADLPILLLPKVD